MCSLSPLCPPLLQRLCFEHRLPGCHRRHRQHRRHLSLCQRQPGRCHCDTLAGPLHRRRAGRFLVCSRHICHSPHRGGGRPHDCWRDWPWFCLRLWRWWVGGGGEVVPAGGASEDPWVNACSSHWRPLASAVQAPSLLALSLGLPSPTLTRLCHPPLSNTCRSPHSTPCRGGGSWRQHRPTHPHPGRSCGTGRPDRRTEPGHWPGGPRLGGRPVHRHPCRHCRRVRHCGLGGWQQRW